MTNKPYAEVALPLPIKKTFHYKIPRSMRPGIQRGALVKVPFGHSTKSAYCVDFHQSTPVDRVKSIKDVRFPSIINNELLRLTHWVSSYYLCSWGEAIQAAIPGSVRSGTTSRKQNAVKLAIPEEHAKEYIQDLSDHYSKRAYIVELLLQEPEHTLLETELTNAASCSRSPIRTLEKHDIVETFKKKPDRYGDTPLPDPDSIPESLTSAQQEALKQIHHAYERQVHETFLLHGVTGSGKTEVYLRAISELPSSSKQVIVLLPEISLTPQAVARFTHRFENISVLHSSLTPAQRRNEWNSVRNGESRIVIGARSAVFAPVQDLGLIVVDEEHDNSYKQGNTPRYHARKTAIKRAKMNDCPVILGSATPSLRSYHRARSGSYQKIHLPERVSGSRMPDIRVLNMKEELGFGEAPWSPISEPLEGHIHKTLRDDGQVLLFLNRRGYANSLYCPKCQEVYECKQCNIAMTYHKSFERLLCHYCLTRKNVPSRCDDCNSPSLQKVGMGTERVQTVINRTFPDATIQRMDSDTMNTYKKYRQIMNDLQNQSIDILIGTQMIAKGLHFPGVKLIGVISADTSLQLTDFRSAERTFQLILQIAGRTGRGKEQGTVLLQTFHPDHYSIQSAKSYNYGSFYRQELNHRKTLDYPPYRPLLRILFRGSSQSKVQKKAGSVRDKLSGQEQNVSYKLLGPRPAPLEKINNQYRYHLLLKLKEPAVARKLEEKHRKQFQSSKNVQIALNMDPETIL